MIELEHSSANGWQSSSKRHSTQVPSPSQYWPPFEVHAVPGATFSLPQRWSRQTAFSQSLPGIGHSSSTSQLWHAPLAQARPGSQAVPQAPQFETSVSRSTHFFPHFV